MRSAATKGIAPAALRGGWGMPARSAWLTPALYACLTAIALYPLLSVSVPPLVDYPNHLARMHILSQADGSVALRQNYVTDWKLYPNMAMELTVPLLARVMSIYMAGKVFAATAMLALLGGTIALRKVLHGRVGLWPVLTFLLLYNHIFFWGFLGYLFTAGLSLFALSGWIALRERPLLLRVAVFSAVSLVLYVCHLFGLFVYGLLVLGYEIWRTRNTVCVSREMTVAWLVTAAQFALPFVLFVHWATGGLNTEPSITEYGPAATRFAALVSPVHFGLPSIDISTAVFLAVVFALCRAGRSIGFATELNWPVCLLTLAAIVMPQWLSGVWGTHLRIPTVIACVVIAGVRSDAEAHKTQMRIIACAIALFCLRTAVISDAWKDLDRKFAEFRAAMEKVAVGSRVLVVEDNEDFPNEKTPVYGMQFWHVPALAVIDRAAFLPYLFTEHVAVRAARRVALIDTPVGVPLSRTLLLGSVDQATSTYPVGYRIERYVRAYWSGWPRHYDYVVVIRFANDSNPDPARLVQVHRGSFFDIHRVVRPPRIGSSTDTDGDR